MHEVDTIYKNSHHVATVNNSDSDFSVIAFPADDSQSSAVRRGHVSILGGKEEDEEEEERIVTRVTARKVSDYLTDEVDIEKLFGDDNSHSNAKRCITDLNNSFGQNDSRTIEQRGSLFNRLPGSRQHVSTSNNALIEVQECEEESADTSVAKSHQSLVTTATVENDELSCNTGAVKQKNNCPNSPANGVSVSKDAATGGGDAHLHNYHTGKRHRSAKSDAAKVRGGILKAPNLGTTSEFWWHARNY